MFSCGNKCPLFGEWPGVSRSRVCANALIKRIVKYISRIFCVVSPEKFCFSVEIRRKKW